MLNTIFLRGGQRVNQHERIHHYYSQTVGWMELRVGDKGLRSLSFISKPAVQQSSEKDPLMARVIKELDGYFAGNLKCFSIPLDPYEGTPFQRKVWEHLQQIPYCQVRSYRDVAEAVGAPQGARAVGLANKRNCIAIIIPCHRVISANGELGGYDSGLHIKRALLELEGVKVSRVIRKTRTSKETLIRKVIRDLDLSSRSLFRQVKQSVMAGAKTSRKS
jgi:methylated-DNA-[protein]-cysteine S-methyltransferase